MDAAFAGFRIGLGLIVAIGAQNAYVLRQGLRGEHVFAVALFCAVSDAALIALGVSGFGALTSGLPWLAPLLRWGGVVFLTYYALRAFGSAWRGGAHLNPAYGPAEPLPKVLGVMVVLTWANPHVWIDTVLLLGAVSAQFPAQGLQFGFGAVVASFSFFFALAYGARLFAPVFAKPRAWQILDLGVGCLLLSVAWRLAVMEM
ncbi:LysE/ArgO family amino acid transporter [Thioclava sp. 'Guangxiensis']|uniref:LysE/ArgO family amino acid transporter n=1 Tax=Thioclava sp. 'Guangxiensis' TaxID=3149044 RepID=UPI0038778FCC